MTERIRITLAVAASAMIVASWVALGLATG